MVYLVEPTGVVRRKIMRGSLMTNTVLKSLAVMGAVAIVLLVGPPAYAQTCSNSVPDSHLLGGSFTGLPEDWVSGYVYWFGADLDGDGVVDITVQPPDPNDRVCSTNPTQSCTGDAVCKVCNTTGSTCTDDAACKRCSNDLTRSCTSDAGCFISPSNQGSCIGACQGSCDPRGAEFFCRASNLSSSAGRCQIASGTGSDGIVTVPGNRASLGTANNVCLRGRREEQGGRL